MILVPSSLPVLSISVHFQLVRLELRSAVAIPGELMNTKDQRIQQYAQCHDGHLVTCWSSGLRFEFNSRSFTLPSQYLAASELCGDIFVIEEFGSLFEIPFSIELINYHIKTFAPSPMSRVWTTAEDIGSGLRFLFHLQRLLVPRSWHPVVVRQRVTYATRYGGALTSCYAPVVEATFSVIRVTSRSALV